MHGRVRTGIQFVPSSQLQSQIVPRGIRTVRLSPLLGNTAGLISCLFHLPLLLFAAPPVTRPVWHRSIRQAPGNFVGQQPMREKQRQLAEFPWISLSIATTLAPVYRQHRNLSRVVS